MTALHAESSFEFVVPARTLRGSRDTMLADIDQAIMGLLALRHLISGDASVPAPASRKGPIRRSLGELGEALRSFRVAVRP